MTPRMKLAVAGLTLAAAGVALAVGLAWTPLGGLAAAAIVLGTAAYLDAATGARRKRGG